MLYAELLHKQHQSLCAGVLYLLDHKIGPAVLVGELVVDQHVKGELEKISGNTITDEALREAIKVYNRSRAAGGIHPDGTALVGHVVSHNGNLVIVENLEQLRVVADDTGGDNFQLDGLITPTICDTLRPMSQNFRVAMKDKLPCIFLAHPQQRKPAFGLQFSWGAGCRRWWG